MGDTGQAHQIHYTCTESHTQTGDPAQQATAPSECPEAGFQLVQLGPLLRLHPPVQELTDAVHLVGGQVTVGAEVEGEAGELHQDAAPASAVRPCNGLEGLAVFRERYTLIAMFSITY